MKYLTLFLLLMLLTSFAQAQGPALPERAIVPPPPAPQLPAVETSQPKTVEVQKVPVPAEKPVPTPAATPTPTLPPLPSRPVPSSDVEKMVDSVPATPVTPVPKQTSPKTVTPPHSDSSGQYPAPVETRIYHQTAPAYGSSPVWGTYYSGVNPAGAEGVFVGPSISGGLHPRYPYYDYRRPWYPRGPRSLNVDIVW